MLGVMYKKIDLDLNLVAGPLRISHGDVAILINIKYTEVVLLLKLIFCYIF